MKNNQSEYKLKIMLLSHPLENTVSVYIFKVTNPAQVFVSVDITAKIEHVEMCNGYTCLFFSTDLLFSHYSTQ